jgi:integrase
VETVLAICARLPVQEALMALTALFTGMWWGEVCGMSRQYLHTPGASGGARYLIDAEHGAAHEDVHARRFFGPPIGGAGRTIDLPGFLADLLADHAATTNGRELLFANRRAAAIRHTDFLNRWRPACDGTLPPICPGLRFHDLRHTHKNMLIELDVPEILHDERLGHHPPGMRAVYAHTTPAMRKQMIDGLDGSAQVSVESWPANPYA